MPIAHTTPSLGLQVADRVASLVDAAGPGCQETLGSLIDAVMASATVLEQASEVADRAEIERYRAAMTWARRTAEVAALERMAAALERFELVHGVAVVADELASLRGIELCRITVVAPDGRAVQVASGASFGARLPSASVGGEPGSPDGQAMTQGQLVLWRRPPETDLLANDGLHRLGLTSVFALPLWCGDRLGGAIMAGSTGGHRLVTDEHLVVAAIAGQLLMAAAGGIDGVHQLALRLALPGGEVR